MGSGLGFLNKLIEEIKALPPIKKEGEYTKHPRAKHSVDYSAVLQVDAKYFELKDGFGYATYLVVIAEWFDFQ